MRTSAVKAYKLFKSKVGQTITPQELEAVMNVGPYANREVWIMKNRLGLQITTLKDGRSTIGYTLVAMPEVEPALITAHFAKASAKNRKAKIAAIPKPAKIKAEKPAKVAKPAKIKAEKPAKVAVEVAEQPQVLDPVFATLEGENAGEVAGFSVDPDFDEGDDFPEFLTREFASAE